MTAYLVYDVFTTTRFGGNPLAVIPDASALPEADLQKIAREFNFSESTFVFPPADPAHAARVRIFTPTRELQFAGHPTIGTAVALSDLGRAGPEMVLELGVGPIACTVDGNAARFTTLQPLQRLSQPEPDLVARCLSLPDTALRTDRHAPVLATLGLPFVLAELADRAALDAARPNIEALREAEKRHPEGQNFPIFCYTRDGTAINARMFAPLGSVPEDPATGSASATLTALLGEIENRDLTLDITQGVAMGRPSQIVGTVTTANGRATAVTIGGSAVRVMEGRLV